MALYGLKQALRAWNAKLDKSLSSLGLIKSANEPMVYYKHLEDFHIIIGVCVDDFLIIENSGERIEEFKKEMKKLFDMTDLGLLSSYLGIQVAQVRGEIILTQRSFALNILKEFDLLDCNPTKTLLEVRPNLKHSEENKVDKFLTYRRIIGSLRYLTHTRPDIMFNVAKHIKAIKCVLRYIKGTLDFRLRYMKSEQFVLAGYSDNDYVGDYDDQKST
ncbi:unnamed protein product [Spirodela intermedia]|uniref:Reverse transcriptase Ty1/copia-type domain-containing protein n=1 Tax=Spirodela intermedia TaxID=51605 RepID=A0ABN7E8Y7_SPIIN|nr:unnamed protein product [Spirodela intermedia]